MARGRLTNGSLSERILTRDRLTNDSLVGIRLLAEMVRTTAAPGHEYLQVLNRQTQVRKEKTRSWPKLGAPTTSMAAGQRKKARKSIASDGCLRSPQ